MYWYDENGNSMDWGVSPTRNGNKSIDKSSKQALGCTTFSYSYNNTWGVKRMGKVTNSNASCAYGAGTSSTFNNSDYQSEDHYIYYWHYGSTWATSKPSSSSVTTSTSSTTLYFYVRLPVTYNFIYTSTDDMETITVGAGLKVTMPTNMSVSRTGYTFTGWRTTSGGGYLPAGYTFFADYNEYGMYYYPVWTPNTYEITLDSTYYSSSSATSGSSVTSSGTTAIYENYEINYCLDSDCTELFSSITLPTYTGYTFGGYYTAKAGTGTQIISSDGTLTTNATTTYFTADTTLYAKWTIKTYTLTVRYYRQYVTNSTNIKATQSSCTVSDNYSTTTDGIIGCGALGSTSTKYYASVSHTYSTSSYYITIARQNTSHDYYMNATTSSSTVPTTSSSTNSVTYSWKPTSNATIYVNVFQRYTITYNGNGYTSGTVPSTQYKIHGTSATLASNSLTKTNYSANGWNTSTAYKETPDYTSSSTYSTNANLTLYANFVPNTCSVTIELLMGFKDGTPGLPSTEGGTVSVTSTVYDTSSSTLVTTQTVSITSASATQTVQKNSLMTFTPTPTSGYVFCGVSSSRLFFNRVANNSWTPTSSITLYVLFRELSNNLLKYDSTNNYYYFEDGYMPQTYAEMISSGLNATITSNGTRLGTYSLENGTSYQLASYDEYYYLGFTAPKTMSLALESYTTSGIYSFTKGTWYWFRFEPIRWRVSSVDCQNGGYLGMYIRNYTVVSDLVLWYDCMDTNENHKEGDKAYDLTFTSSLRDGNFETMLSTFTNSYSNGKLQFSGSISAEWQKFGEVGQANPVQVDTTHTTGDYELTKTNKYTSGSTSSLRVASTDEISDTVGNTKAKASCLVAFLMGSSNNQYSKYWTRDLGNNLNAGKVVAKNGLTRSEWLSNSNGIRFAYTMSEGSRGNL